MDPMYCDVHETTLNGRNRLLLTVWNSPGEHGESAKAMAERIARLLNESEYPLGESVAVRLSPSSP
jgi:hypothetical protein